MRDAPSNNQPRSDERLYELIAGEQLRSLSPEESAELESLLAAMGAERGLDAERVLGELLVLMDEADQEQSLPPESLTASLAMQGRAMVAGPIPMPAAGKQSEPQGRHDHPDRGGRGWMFLGIAASFIAIGAGWLWFSASQRSQIMQQRYEQRLAQMDEQVAENNAVLARARSRATELETQLAASAEREIQIAQRLASATESLTQAELAIARYETPVDPGVLKFNREKLLELPATLVRSWAPFDLPDAPAEQRGLVQGDVAWNNELQTGYLRFVGLEVNDPLIEQYQVWVIDERGLEQKVSGGVFDANADGEVIVPIEPGIDVGRVALFAVTIEAPGGTWVPDLERRVVVAPVDEG